MTQKEKDMVKEAISAALDQFDHVQQSYIRKSPDAFEALEKLFKPRNILATEPDEEFIATKLQLQGLLDILLPLRPLILQLCEDGDGCVDEINAIAATLDHPDLT
jgi:hypothetical protein